MKLIASLLFVFTSMLPLSAATVTTLSAVPSAVSPGGLFSVDVIVSGHGDEILSFGFDVDAIANVTWLGYTVGPDFLDTPIPGTDVFAIANLGLTADPVLLATLQFQAGPSPGPVFLGITSDLSNLDQGLGLLDAGFVDISTSAAINAVPEPSTPALLGAGLALLVVRIRSSSAAPKR